MNYRSDIQILRGIAVIFVVLFHLGFSALKSGFLGVDIFFVISGFLMAVLYDKENKTEFYLRRAKRLLPGYYAVIFFTLIFSYLLTTPNETEQVVNQVKYATIFSSNIGFWAQNSYFSKAEFTPLLHLWSLGVEIQFYLIVPIVFWLLNKHKLFYLFILFASLSLCFLIVGVSPKTSFFMLPFRLWEFLIGYGAAYYFTYNGSLKFNNHKWLGFLGLLILCVIPFFTVDGEALSIINGHPGLFALLVALATAVVLVFGLPTFMERSILSKLFEHIGKYSYSIYLVHFPIIVIYLSVPFGGTSLSIPTLQDGVVILSLIVITSALLYYFVESKKFNISIKSIVLASSAILIILTIVLPKVQLQFISKEERFIFEAFSDRSTYRCGKIIRAIDPSAISCDLTLDVHEPEQKLMLVGNSHSDSIKTSFVNSINKGRYNSKLFFLIPNNPLMQGGITPKKVVDEAINKGVKKLVLHYSPRGITNNEIITNVISLSNSAGIKVYLIEPVPVWKEHIPKGMYQTTLYGNDVIERQTKSNYLQQNSSLLNFVRNVEDDNFTALPIVQYFCDPNCRYSSIEGKPLYFDKGHLTLTGSNMLNNVFIQILED